MKKLNKAGASLAALSVLVFAPIISHAHSNINLAGSIGVNLEGGVDANTYGNTNIDISTGTNSDTNVNTGVEADIENGESESGTSSETILKVNSSGVAVVSSAQVSSESDLEVFSENVSERNDKVDEVNITSDNDESEVVVVYRHEGKLLGFIPVTIKSRTIVEARANAEADVRSRLPWWSFLVLKKNYAGAEIESRLKNNATVGANAQVDASAQAKAQVAEAIIAELKTHTNAQASVNR